MKMRDKEEMALYVLLGVVVSMLLFALVWTAVLAVKWPQSHVGIHALARKSTPTAAENWKPLEPIATPSQEPAAGAVFDLSQRSEVYVVCVPDLGVKNNPGDQFPDLYYLHSGDMVQVRERTLRGKQSWAEVDLARYVWEGGLCWPPQ